MTVLDEAFLATSPADTRLPAPGPGFGGRRRRTDRLKIWELPSTCHCVTIGTCLSLPELRRTAVRLGLFHDAARMTDYELHGAYVHAMDTRNRASTAVQKLLESNHAGAIRKAARCADAAAMERFWDDSVGEGMIPGAFWALLTHPLLDAPLEKRVFGEVHMMSHLCGASHRGDARTLAAIDRQRGELARRLSGAADAQRRQLAERDEEIARLKRLVTGLEPFVHEVARLREGLAAARSPDDPATRGRLAECERQVATLEQTCDRLEAERADLALRLETAERRADDLAERLLAVLPQQPAGGRCPASCPLNLEGRCIAYIGGRPQTVSRIRAYVERCNGCLLHHDGGPEQSARLLDGILGQADIVVVPVDCVSHGAMERAKAECLKRNALFQPLPSASFSAFAAAIAGLPGEPATDVCTAAGAKAQ